MVNGFIIKSFPDLEDDAVWNLDAANVQSTTAIIGSILQRNMQLQKMNMIPLMNKYKWKLVTFSKDYTPKEYFNSDQDFQIKFYAFSGLRGFETVRGIKFWGPKNSEMVHILAFTFYINLCWVGVQSKFFQAFNFDAST